MVLNLIRFIKGYVFFVAIGKFPERFMNLTIKNGIHIWDTCSSNGQLSGKMLLRDYMNIRKIAKKARVKLKVKKRYGIPFIIKKYRPRIGVLIGFILFFIIIGSLSSFVWSVNIKGLETISYTSVMEILKDNGLYPGAYTGSVDVQSIERNTILKSSRIGWISVNIQGCIVTVEVKEKSVRPESEDVSYPCNIKAAKDGVITSIKSYQGVTQVLEGSAVVKGDLLVSGIFENQLGGSRLVHSKAVVTAKTYEEKTFTQPYNVNTIHYSDKVILRKKAQLLWFEFPCSVSYAESGKYLKRYTKSAIVNNDVILPVGIIDEKNILCEEKSIKLSKKQAMSAIENQITLYELFDLSKAKVLKREITQTNTKNALEYKVKYTLEEDIAVKEKIEVS